MSKVEDVKAAIQEAWNNPDLLKDPARDTFGMFLDRAAKRVIALYSPPPVQADVREAVAKIIETCEGHFCEHWVILGIADQILALIDPQYLEDGKK